MRKLYLKNIQSLNNQSNKILSLLSYRITGSTVELIESELTLLAKELDVLNENTKCSDLLKIALSSNSRTRNCFEKGFKVLRTQINILENTYRTYKDEDDFHLLSVEYSKRGYKECCIEVLEGRKLQLNLVEQKGYYLLQSSKEKIKIQEDILVVAAQILQDLTHHENLTQRVIIELEGLDLYRACPEVTEQEEQIISSVYSLLFDILLDLNFNLTV